jgi:transketolase
MGLPVRPELASPRTAAKIRLAVLDALHAAGGGHFGGSLSCVEMLLALFAARPMACIDGEGDVLLLSKGHASMSLYAVLHELGAEIGPLAGFGSFGSPLQGHPDRNRLGCMDFSFGSLGQGVAVGIGMALACADEGRHVWVVLGDGECQEGMIWESALVASRHRLGNLHALVDANGAQECGWGHDAALEQDPMPDAAKKWEAFGWTSREIDGHDTAGIVRHLVAAANDAGSGRPSALVLRTRKQWAAPLMMSPSRAHHTRLTETEYRVVRDTLCRVLEAAAPV